MWIDDALKWNPKDYGGIKSVRIPADKGKWEIEFGYRCDKKLIFQQ